MVKIWFILMLLFLVGNCYGINKYVATTGNDANNGNSPATAYLTVGKAASVAIAIGDSILIGAGTFSQATQVIIAVGVYVKGVGSFAGGTRVNMVFSVAGSNGFNNGAWQLLSAAPDTIHNQSITGIWFDGTNFTCLSAILIKARSNVTVQYCNFTNFGVDALNFNGKTNQLTGFPPATFAKNNKVLNCSFTNCSDRIKQAANSVSCGSICLAGQRNILFQFDTLANATNPLGITHNGNLFGAVQGNNIGAKWLNCIFTKPPDTGNQFNFGIESWYDQGGCQYKNNTYTGGGNAIDIGYGGANKGDSTYSWLIRNNLFTNPALLTSSGTQPVLSIAVQLEPSKNVTPSCPCSSIPLNADIGDAIIDSNYLKNMGTLVQITLNNYVLNFCDNIYINHNVVESSGYTNNTYFGILNFVIGLGARIDSIFIDNNTLVGSHTGTIAAGTATVGAPKAILILQADTGAITDIYNRNNIELFGSGYGYLLFRGKYATNRVKTQNNITFQNAFTNNPATLLTAVGAGNFVVGKQYTIANIGTTSFTAIGASSNTVGVVFTANGIGSGTGSATAVITPLNFTNTGNLKVDPLFVSGSAPIDYHLASGSPGISNGLTPPAYTAAGYYIGAYPPSVTTPTLPWTPASPIIFGTALGAAQLNAVAMDGVTVVPGTHVYSPTLGFVPTSIGTLSITDVFTPTNQAVYSVVSKTVTIQVNPQPVTGVVSNTTQTFSNTPLQPTFTSNPAGISYSITLDGVGGGKINAGTYTYVVGITDPNYSMTPLTGTFTISPAPASISVSNNVQQYDSTLKNVTVSTIPTGLATIITGAPQRYKGTYSISVSLNSSNYIASVVNTTLTITPGQTTVTWNPANLTYPTVTGAPQTNATSPKTGVYTYTPPSGTLLNSGAVVPLQLDFVPSDTNIAPLLGITRNIIVNQGTTSLITSDTIQFADGNPKFITAIAGQSGTVLVTYSESHTSPGNYPFIASFTSANYTAPIVFGTLHILSNPASIFITNYADRVYTGFPISVTVTSLYPYTLTYNGSVTPPTNVNASITVIATISDGGIHTGADTVIMNIIKANQSYTWPLISPITNPAPLSATQLNISSPVPFTVVYNPVSGTILGAGTWTLSARITPTDVANYNVIDVTNTIIVNAGLAIINVSNTSQVFNNLPHPITVTTVPANLDSLAILYGLSTTPPTDAGSYPFTVRLINPNVTATPVSGTLIITQAVPTLSWAIPLPIQFGTALSSVQLNPVSNVPGTFTFNYPSGSIPLAGTIALTATFHPTSANYSTATISVPLVIYGTPFLNYFISHGQDLYLNLPGQTPNLQP